MGMSLENLTTAVTENDKILIALFKEKILGTFDINDIYNKLVWTNNAMKDIEQALIEKGITNAENIPINKYGNIIRNLGTEYTFIEQHEPYMTLSPIRPEGLLDSFQVLNPTIEDTIEEYMECEQVLAIKDVNFRALNGDYEESEDE